MKFVDVALGAAILAATALAGDTAAWKQRSVY
jgi:hypothetical protein